MKNFRILIIMLGLTYTLSALNVVSSIPFEQKTLIGKIVKSLNIPDTQENKEMVYKQFKPFVQTENWNVRWTSNISASNSKIENASTKVCDLMIYNNNRVVNVTLIYFSEQKQLYVNTKEFVASDSETVLKNFRKVKEKPDYIKKEENDNYAYFQKKDFMSYELYHIKAPVGMMVYESTIFIDIK